MKTVKKETSKNQYLFISIVVLLLSTTVIGLNEKVPSKEAYQELFIAKEIAADTFFSIVDDRAVHEKRLVTTPFHWFISIFDKIPSIKISVILIGVTIPLLLQRVLEKRGMRKNHAAIANILLISSPAFLNLFATFRPELMMLWLILVYGNLAFSENELEKNVGRGSLFFLPFFGGIHGLLFLLIGIITAASLNKKKERKELQRGCGILALGLVTYLAVNYAIPFSQLWIEEASFIPRNNLAALISEAGGKFGLSVFTLMLMGTTLIKKRMKKRKKNTIVIILLLLSSSLMVYTNINIILNVVAAVLAMQGIMLIYKSKWSVDVIKHLTLTIIVCGLILSLVITTSVAKSQHIDTNIQNQLQAMHDESTVLSGTDNSFLLKYYGYKTVTDNKDVKGIERYETTKELFYSRNLQKTERLLKKHGIKYLLIDNEMRAGKIWHKKDEGLLFLIGESKKFKKVFETKKITVIEII